MKMLRFVKNYSYIEDWITIVNLLESGSSLLDGFLLLKTSENSYIMKAKKENYILYNSFLPEILIILNYDKMNFFFEYKLEKK